MSFPKFPCSPLKVSQPLKPLSQPCSPLHFQPGYASLRISSQHERRIFPDTCSEQQEVFLEIITIGVKPTERRERNWTQLHWSRGRRIFKPWGELMEKFWRMLARVVAGQGRGYSCRHLLKLDSCPPLETGRQGTSFLMTAFQRDGFQVLKKDIPGQQHIVPQKATKTKFTVVSFL